MELPDLCQNCHKFVMVDFENLTRRPLGRLYTVYGYSCPYCNVWKQCFYSTRQLDENLGRLKKMRPTHPSFAYHLAKTLRRAQEINRRARSMDGSVRLQDVAFTR